MKVNIPKDYHTAFQASILIAKLIEQGRFATAFDTIPFSEEARSGSLLWTSDISRRREILNRCETILAIGGYKPDEQLIALLESFESALANPADSIITITVNDLEAAILANALEIYTRFSLGQVDQALDDFSFSSSKPSVRAQDKEVINEMRHIAITTGGASFGITNLLLPDDVRNGWLAKKVIDHHLAHKRQPEGGRTLRFDTPMRIGSCTAQDVTIDDPEFSVTPRRSSHIPSSPSF